MAASFKQMIKSGHVKRADAMQIRLDDIHEEPGFNLRSEGPDLEASIDALATHIKAGGMYPPLEVRPRPEGGVFLVDGHRRRRALIRVRDSGEPIEWIRIAQFTGNDADRVARVITSAEGRNLSQIEIARGYARLRAFGLSASEIAAKVGKSRQHVEQLMLLHEAPMRVQRMVESGQVSAKVAIETQRRHGDSSAEVLEKQVARAHSSGKKRVTASDMQGGTLLDAVRQVVESVPAGSLDADEVPVNGAALRVLIERAGLSRRTAA